MIQHAFARDSLEPKCTELKIMCKRQVDDDGDDGDDDDDGNDDVDDNDNDNGDDVVSVSSYIMMAQIMCKR